MNRYSKNILKLTLLSILISSGCAKEDISSIPRSEVFIKYFGSERAEEVIEMTKTLADPTPGDGMDHGQYFILGTTTYSDSSDVGDRDVMMVLTDGEGNTLWETREDFSADPDNRGDDIPTRVVVNRQDSSRAWVIGTSDFDEVNESILLIDVSLADGTILNSTTFQYADERSGVDTVLVPTRGADLVYADGGTSIIMLGSVKTGIDQLNDGANNYSIFLASVLNDENLLIGDYLEMSVNWDQFDGFDTGNDYGVRLLEDNDQFFYVASSAIPADGNRSKVLVKWFDSADGNEISDARRIGNSDNQTPVNLVSDDFNLYITGSSGENRAERAFFIRINKDLKTDGVFTLVQSTESGDGSSLTLDDEGNQGKDIVQLINGNFYIVGTLKNYTQKADINDPGVLKLDEIFLTKVNGNGEVIEGSTQVYGSNEVDQGNAIWLNNDGSLLIGGTMGFGGVATMMTLIKTNENGELSK